MLVWANKRLNVKKRGKMTYYTKDKHMYKRSIFSKPDHRGSVVVQPFVFKGKASELTNRLSLSLTENVGTI